MTYQDLKKLYSKLYYIDYLNCYKNKQSIYLIEKNFATINEDLVNDKLLCKLNLLYDYLYPENKVNPFAIKGTKLICSDDFVIPVNNYESSGKNYLHKDIIYTVKASKVAIQYQYIQVEELPFNIFSSRCFYNYKKRRLTEAQFIKYYGQDLKNDLEDSMRYYISAVG